MPARSIWIFLYAFVLAGVLLADRFTVWPSPILFDQPAIAWTLVAAMLTFGVASSQRRRLLRQGGSISAMFLILGLAAFFTFQAAEKWHQTPVSPREAFPLSILALFSVVLVWILARLQPRDGIEARGYAVTLADPPPIRTLHEQRTDARVSI